jgi:uncharacterized repeat protein (TIGR03803 family)
MVCRILHLDAPAPLHEYARWDEKSGRDEALYRFRLTEFSPTRRLPPGAVSAVEIVMRLSRFFAAPIISLAVAFASCVACVAQVVTDVYTFTGNSSSSNPGFVTPAQGRDGQLYGTTTGLPNSNGSIFRLSAAGDFALLDAVNGVNGANPYAGLTLSAGGNFYGTTWQGGSANLGVLFSVSPNGTYSVLHDFQGGSDGSAPVAAPILASDGNLYGTTGGTVYKYTRSGAYSTIYQFVSTQASSVTAPLIQGTDGNLYGTARFGGANGCGSIFKLKTSGTLVFVRSFPCYGGPNGPVVEASDGNFYGATDAGGSLGLGTIYKMSPGGVISTLYNFTGGPTDGSNPFGGLVQGTDGNLYGPSQTGGTSDNGTLFQISTSGAYKVLYSFGSSVGSLPSVALLQHTNGSFYGTAEGGADNDGVVYSLNMGLGPFITFVGGTGHVGETVEILGQGWSGTTAVTFDGVPATSFSVVSDTYMTTVVPSGAAIGPLVVTTPGGSLTSNVSFRIIN